jgi:hypothetical protein
MTRKKPKDKTPITWVMSRVLVSCLPTLKIISGVEMEMQRPLLDRTSFRIETHLYLPFLHLKFSGESKLVKTKLQQLD